MTAILEALRTDNRAKAEATYRRIVKTIPAVRDPASGNWSDVLPKLAVADAKALREAADTLGLADADLARDRIALAQHADYVAKAAAGLPEAEAAAAKTQADWDKAQRALELAIKRRSEAGEAHAPNEARLDHLRLLQSSATEIKQRAARVFGD